jgi:hypothetical protein
MKTFVLSLIAVLSTISPALADEVTDVIGEALAAYESGDIAGAKDDLEYAVELIGQMKSAGLEAFMPEPLAGWVRTFGDSSGEAAMAMFGGGSMATAEYTGAEGSFTITLTSDSPMLQGMMAMFSSTATMAMMGDLVRIQREKFVIQNGTDITGIIDQRVMVQAQGSPIAAMQAHLEAMDLAALAAF